MAQAPVPITAKPAPGLPPLRRRELVGADAPEIGRVNVALPEHEYEQEALVRHLERRWGGRHKNIALLKRLHGAVAVNTRRLALSLDDYERLDGFGDANDAFIRVGTELGAQAIEGALLRAGCGGADVDAIFFTTVTGVAAPTIDARIINRLGLRRDVRRTPMFGLGCVGGAAALARTGDWLLGHRDRVAVLLSVELCSLTLQEDFSVANIIASGLFGDAAAAVVLTGADRAIPSSAGRGQDRARVVDSRSAFFRDTERVMGWDVGATGFKIVLSAEVPSIVKRHLPTEVDEFLSDHGLSRADISHWICHPGGPKVITAMEEALELPDGALAITRTSLASVGNLSSASVLHVLGETQDVALAGELGLLMAMGPGFCAELVLLSW